LLLTAEQFNDVARSHLGIENKLHWRLDVVFNEDKACIRNDHAAENMTILKKMGIGYPSKSQNKT
jgi:predicted transposase YbfD/YdcC